MSSLKDLAAVLQLLSPDNPQNKYDMSVTPEVSHLEMGPYVLMAAARSENQRSTAVLIVLSFATRGVAVGAGE